VVDLRKSIDTLSILVSGCLSQDPFSGHVFGFCNRKRTIIKLLFWDLCEDLRYVELQWETMMVSTFSPLHST